MKVNADPGLAGRLKEQQDRFGPPGGTPLDVVTSQADGAHLWDVRGSRYVDFQAAWGAVALGHTHTRIAAALVEQCLRLAAPPGDCRNDRLPPLLQKLCALTGFQACTLLPGSREALDAALASLEGRAARTGGAAGVLHCSADPAGARPGWRRAPFGDLAGVLGALAPDTAAILVEPLGGAALRLPPRGFLRGLREACDARGLLLLADERRSGLGRTGRLFAYEHEGIRPDGVLVGEALGGGFLPLGAWLATRDLPDPAGGAPEDAFAGNPLASAVASATLDVLVEERLADRAAELGAYFLARLRDLELPLLRDLRGLGLWVALDLDGGPARPFREALAREGLLCGESGGDTLVFTPPLVVTREQLDWAVATLEKVLG